jgi:hypothetical protein
MRTEFWSENLKARDHLKSLSIDERTILEWILDKWGGGEDVEWVHLPQRRNQWWAIVNTVMNLLNP